MMRPQAFARRIIFMSVAMTMGVVASHATPIAEVDFEGLTPGTINGQGGGSGFTGNFTTTPAANANAAIIDTTAVPLSYSIPGGGFFMGGTRAFQISANNDNIAFRSLTGAVNGDDVYVSFLLRPQGTIGVTNNDFVSLWFDNISTGGHTSLPNIGFKSNQTNGAGPLDIFTRLSNGNEVYSPQPSPTGTVNGTTYFVVGRLFKTVSGAGNNYNRFSLWINPAYSASGTPDVTATSGASLSSFSILGFRSATLAAGDSIAFDGLKVGTTWDDVYDVNQVLFAEYGDITARQTGSSVTVAWETTAEIDNAGFNVFRANLDGSVGERLTANLIPAEGDGSGGASYSFVDENPGSPASYFIQDVDLNGVATLVGPVSAAANTINTSVTDWTAF